MPVYYRGVLALFYRTNFESNIMKILKCEMCGKQDKSVKKIGFTLCPACNKKLGKSMEAAFKYNREHEFDGGGGA